MLRHPLTLAARTSFRSLFAKPNAPVYVSRLRSLSSQKLSNEISPLPESLPSATSHSRSQGIQLTMLVERSKIISNPIRKLQRPFSEKPSGSGGRLLILCAILGYWLHKKYSQFQQNARISKLTLCRLDCHPKLEKSILDDVNAKLKKANEHDNYDYVWKAPTVKPFEGIKVSYVLTRPVSRHWFGKEGTDVMYNVAINMCDSLKLRGVYVECSEDGVRYTQDTVRMHLEKKCGSCDLSTGPFVESTSRCPIQKTDDAKTEDLEKNIKICRKDFHPKLPTSGFQDAAKKGTPFDNAAVSFEITRPSFLKWFEEGTVTSLAVEVKVNLPNFTATADIKEICEGLKRHDINVDSSESGLRRGLAEYVLKHMNDGITKHLEKKCDCGYFSATLVAPQK